MGLGGCSGFFQDLLLAPMLRLLSKFLQHELNVKEKSGWCAVSTVIPR